MKLTDLKVVYICPDHNEKYHSRKLHMDTLLKQIGFHDITHYKSGHEGYPDCLSSATVHILQTYMHEPVLILEDDVDFTGMCEFYMDASADAIYFGLSRYAGSATVNHWEGLASFAPVAEPSQVRVLNMLSAHAVLYISPAYKQAVIDIFTANKGVAYYNDVLISRLQPRFWVLANRMPSFYQSDRLNSAPLEAATRFTIAPGPAMNCVPIGGSAPPAPAAAPTRVRPQPRGRIRVIGR